MGMEKPCMRHCSILLTSDWSDAQLGVTRQPGSPQLVAQNRSHVHRNGKPYRTYGSHSASKEALDYTNKVQVTAPSQ